jgi:hypothetical protein
MALNALGQGYQGTGGSAGSSAFSSVAEALMKVGGRRAAFRQEVAVRAMDHELASIREGKQRDWQSSEAEKDRTFTSQERREQNLHNARQRGAEIQAQSDMQQAELEHSFRTTRYAGQLEKTARRDSFEHETSRADQDSRNRIAEASHQAGIVEHLSSIPRHAGSYSATNSGVTMSSDSEHESIADAAASSKAPKRTPSTPVSEVPTATAGTPPEDAPSAPKAAVADKRHRIGPRPGGPVRPIGQRKKATKEDRSGGTAAVIRNTPLPKLN